jgi:hypothetical protein
MFSPHPWSWRLLVVGSIRRIIGGFDFRKPLHADGVDLGDPVLEGGSFDLILDLAIPENAFQSDERPLLEGFGELREIPPGIDAMPFGAGFVPAHAALERHRPWQARGCASAHLRVWFFLRSRDATESLRLDQPGRLRSFLAEGVAVAHRTARRDGKMELSSRFSTTLSSDKTEMAAALAAIGDAALFERIGRGRFDRGDGEVARAEYPRVSPEVPSHRNGNRLRNCSDDGMPLRLHLPTENPDALDLRSCLRATLDIGSTN